MEIDVLELSLRAYNTLRRNGVDTVERLMGMTDEQLLELRNMGVGDVAEIRRALDTYTQERELTMPVQIMMEALVHMVEASEICRAGKRCLIGFLSDMQEWCDPDIELPADGDKAVPFDVWKETASERDIAIQQLAEHGITFGCAAPDVVKVVRCKDCKWWDSVRTKPDKGICTPPGKGLGGYCVRRGATTGEDFCSQGETGKWEDRHK